MELRKDTPAMAVYDFIFDRITHRELKPGQILTESFLCGSTGAGRSPVRAALRQLANDGFVELRANRSAIVTSFTQKQLRQLYSLREVFLEYALRQTIDAYEEEDFSLLENCLSAMEESFEKRDFDRYTKAVSRFYRTMIDKANNPYLTESANVIINRINVYTCLYDDFYMVKKLKTLSMQSGMVQGIRAGKIAAVIRAHKKLSNEVVVAYDQVVRRNLEKE